METVIYQCGNGTRAVAVGLDAEWCPQIGAETSLPSLLQISLNEPCNATTGHMELDAFIASRGVDACRISFLVDLVNVDCCEMLNRLFQDKAVVKIGFDFNGVILFILL